MNLVHLTDLRKEGFDGLLRSGEREISNVKAITHDT